ncbi:MAG: HEPN domain-containing protein [Candidatus Sulfotelmatobacter sp.]
MKTGPKIELGVLKRSVSEIERRFLKPHLASAPSLKPPTRGEQLDVAAYIVLTHGAIENFVEGLALWVLARSVANWTTRKRVTRATASILLAQSQPVAPDGPQLVFDILRTALDEAKKNISRDINENNGISTRHLRSLFYPIGVDVPNDPVLVGSLELVIAIRHEWAHRSRFGASVPKSAKDAHNAVSDCIKLAEKLAEAASALKP